MIKTTFVALLLCATHSIYSQENLSVSGGEATGSGGTSSYSVGQLVYTTNSGNNGTLTQGVQQGIELFSLSNAEFTGLILKLATYPNPTTDYIVLKVEDSDLENLTYIMYDIQGKTITKGQALQKTTQIRMQHLDMGTYILKVNQSNKELKSFKIIKN
ncbi:putative secreted protein (Por secretion system target) [Mariniflexile fucanivorans]|uniref:Putative secreted protein (Por secretion system target) n=1 Tax=Mariniflexile fucanivorans TaxID=264023 RepID=A0A4R1RL01_9FLAO|nr:T9SS type A sorting domain-containing protein [Mariniflexile fucanivorans]TCL66756.1 putative secreted protein (Por secretion system target) [Mariniflexile fucanivorans]